MDYPIGRTKMQDKYRVEKVNLEIDLYLDKDEGFSPQEFAWFVRESLNEWTGFGIYKRPRKINGIPVREDTKPCEVCQDKDPEWFCHECGGIREVFDYDKILEDEQD